MNSKKKNFKWLIWSTVGVGVVALALFVFMLMYVASYQDNFRSFERSIQNLPEVAEVLEFSRFTGTDEYFVAKVRRTDEETYYYFIKDEIVAHQFPSHEFITMEEAQSIALSVTESRTLVTKSLGMYFEDPIYEFKFRVNQGVEYVIINAITGEVILQFIFN